MANMGNATGRFDRAKERADLREYAAAKLEPAGKTFVCPSCGSGSGPHRTPALKIGEYRGEDSWKCFSCNAGGDVFDLVGAVLGTDDKVEQLEEVERFFGIDQADDPGVARPQKAKPPEKAIADLSDGRAREAAHVESCRAAMSEGCDGFAYLLGRGFTAGEIRRFGFGWDEGRKRVVIPWPDEGASWYHIDRDVTDTAQAKYVKPRSADVGEQPILGLDALGGDVAFVVEGALDAYALRACGQPALALCSTHCRRLPQAMKGVGFSGTAVLMLDADGPGQEGAEDLLGDLLAAGIDAWSVTGKNAFLGAKDAAELLARDREALAGNLDKFAAMVKETAAKRRRERHVEVLAALHADDPATAADDILAMRGFADPVPTGIRGLDAALDGGLRPGVATLGAVSSLGKTTLSVQVADAIAQAGRTVLFVTIEQSAREIVSKSLSRAMRVLAGMPDGVASTNSINDAARRGRWGTAQATALERAVEEYKRRVAPRMRILEGSRQPRVDDVRAAAEAMLALDGEAPVVFIDYLQLLAPQDEHDTDKRVIDRNMMSLRQLARDLSTPVWVISSLNRSSYSGALSMESFKESGAIEYGSDVLLGLQPRGIEERIAGAGNETRAKAEAKAAAKESKRTGLCELKVLKNRNGRVPIEGVPLDFVAVSSLFREVKGE